MSAAGIDALDARVAALAERAAAAGVGAPTRSDVVRWLVRDANERLEQGWAPPGWPHDK